MYWGEMNKNKVEFRIKGIQDNATTIRGGGKLNFDIEHIFKEI